MEPIRIAIVGDHDASRPTHRATNEALRHAASALSARIEASWLPTSSLGELEAAELARFAGFFVAPGSPYRSLDGALRAIRRARETGRPLLGTCAGFQHVILELARNVLGLAEARHAEYEPDAIAPVVEPLACSLAGRRARVLLAAGSRAASCYGVDAVDEEFRCSYGVAARYLPALERAGLVVSGRDESGEVRLVELSGHPFFLATLFVPQLSSEPGRPHPLCVAFVAATQRTAALDADHARSWGARGA